MIEPTTVFLGEKAHQLLKELAKENSMASKYFFTKLLVREARSEATMLTSEKLKERLKLIDEVNDELVQMINHPPKIAVVDRDFSLRPKSIYMRVWGAHKRLEKRGFSPEAIHEYCLDRYGMDYDIKDTPVKSPKKNPSWTGGGARRKMKIDIDYKPETETVDVNHAGA